MGLEQRVYCGVLFNQDRIRNYYDQIKPVETSVNHTRNSLYIRRHKPSDPYRRYSGTGGQDSLWMQEEAGTFYSYSIDVIVKKKRKTRMPVADSVRQMFCKRRKGNIIPCRRHTAAKHPTVIVGCGPAGLFCGYYLALRISSVILERGADVTRDRRMWERFWRQGNCRPDSNVQFERRGAGTFRTVN